MAVYHNSVSPSRWLKDSGPRSHNALRTGFSLIAMALTIVHVACSEVLAFFSATVPGLFGLYPTSTVIQQERIRSGRTFKPRMRSWSLPLGFALQLSLWSLFFTAARADGQCYYPNGDKSFDDIPCYTDGRVSHCCGGNSICLTNGLCVSTNQPYHLSRGSCTDESWGDSCPTTCGKHQHPDILRRNFLNYRSFSGCPKRYWRPCCLVE